MESKKPAESQPQRLTQAQVGDIKAAAAAAKEEVLAQSTLDVLTKSNPASLISANREAEVLKGTERRSCAWQHSPANFEFLAAAQERLVSVAKWMGMTVRRVDQVQVQLVAGTKVLIIKPIPDSDRTGYEIKRYKAKSSGWVNLWPLLGEAGLTVEPGFKELYEVNYIPKTSAFWPGLVIDLSQKKDRRQEVATKKEEEAE